MTQEYVPTTRSAIKYGLYVGIASVILYFLLILTGLYRHPVSVMSNVILIVGIIFGMREHKSLNEGYMTYVQGLGLGTMIAVITGFIVGLFMLIYMSADSALLAQELQLNLDNNEKMGEIMGYSDEEIDAMEASTRAIVKPNVYFLIYLFSYLIVGFLFTLLVAAFQRKNKDIFSE
ncbi:MAG: DUF4199 domain-containing protein [Microscillaceae bacterium]|nr:DUF4199 domain-containing protein [Microscillaceae bacterium]